MTDRPTDRPTDSLAHSLSRRQAHDSLVVRFDISARIADKGGRAGSVGRLSLNLILRFLARSVPFHHLSNRKRREDCREYISEPISGLWVRCARARYRTHTHTHTHTHHLSCAQIFIYFCGPARCFWLLRSYSYRRRRAKTRQEEVRFSMFFFRPTVLSRKLDRSRAEDVSVKFVGLPAPLPALRSPPH